jgi:hypothetical protein
MEQKLTNAIEYLRSRDRYVLDKGNKFLPTTSTHTDIRKTFVEFMEYPRDIRGRDGTTLPLADCVSETQVVATPIAVFSYQNRHRREA